MAEDISRAVIPVTPFQQNCSVVWTAENIACVIDPGGDLARIRSVIAENSLQVENVLLTHAHLDHAAGARVLADELDVPIIGPHKDDLFWLESMPQQSEMFGFPRTESFEPDEWLDDGDQVSFGGEQMEVLHCPGHTPGHVVFYHRQQALAFVGDVLFMGSIGRTDFPRGDHATLISSIRSRLWPLGDDVRFVPGHGPESTFGFERENNPFVADHLFS